MDNLVNSLVTKSIGLTDQQIASNLAANPNMSDAQLGQFMERNGVSPEQMASVSKIPVGQLVSRIAATIPEGQAKLFGDTFIQPQYQVRGDGQDRQVGGIEAVQTYKTKGGINDQLPVGTEVQNYSPTGEFTGSGKTQKVESGLGKFLLGAAVMFGGPALLNSLGGGTPLAGLEAGTGALASGGTGLTAGSSLSGLTGGSSLSGVTGTLGATNTALGGAALGSTLAGATTLPLGTTLGALGAAGAGGSLLSSAAGAGAGAAAGSALGAGAGSALGTTLGTGLLLNAAGNVLGATANQEGISDARNLINEYGTRANDRLTSTYADARDLGAAGRRDLNNIFTNQSTNLNNIINAQAGVYGDTNRNLANNYLNLNTNLNNTINAQAGVYGDTNTALEKTYKDTKTDLNNLYDEQVGYQLPYQKIGDRASTEILANTPYFTKQFGTADLNTELAPNYSFQLGQGQMANQRLGNMSGGALGGNALRGLQDYTQSYASGAYQNAFKNFQDQRSNIYNTLSNMANIGTTSSGQLVNLGNALGGNLGSLSSNYSSNRVANSGQMQNAYNQYGSNLTSGSTNYASNMVNNANTMQGAYNQYGSNLNNAANTFGSNLTNNYATGVNAANVAGLNAANLAVGVGGALASNATAAGANNATALSNLGSTALLGSMINAPIKAT